VRFLNWSDREGNSEKPADGSLKWKIDMQAVPALRPAELKKLQERG